VGGVCVWLGFVVGVLWGGGGGGGVSDTPELRFIRWEERKVIRAPKRNKMNPEMDNSEKDRRRLPCLIQRLKLIITMQTKSKEGWPLADIKIGGGGNCWR